MLCTEGLEAARKLHAEDKLLQPSLKAYHD
jgi:hypothetical protein